MLKKRYTIKTIRSQQAMLEALISQLEEKKLLTLEDCHLYESTTREVEKNLKNLRMNFMNQRLRRGAEKHKGEK